MSTPNLNLALRCQACGGCFRTLDEWHHHLHQPTHLEGARKSAINWGEGEKASAIVINGSVPVGRDGGVVDYLSGLFGGRTIVRDFVWWERKPTVGVAQFGSKEEVQRIVGSLRHSLFFIEPDQRCLVTEGSSLLGMEWNDILLGCEAAAINLDSTPQPPGATPASSTTAVSPAGRSENVEVIRSTGLRHFLACMLTSVQIPKEEEAGTNAILHRFQTLLNEYGGGGGEGGKNQLNVCLGRQWHLRFRNSANQGLDSTPLSFIIRRVVDGDSMITFSSKEFQEIQMKLFDLEEGQILFLSCYPVLGQKIQGNPPSGKVISFSMNHPVTEKLTDVIVSAEPRFVLEDQLWRLIRVVSKFNPYVFSVMAAANYWARVNSVSVGEMEGNYTNMSDPAGLNLLVLLFFQRNGLIPTCKTILDKPHHARLYEEIDIGFSENPKHAKEWRSNNNTSNIDPRSEPFGEKVFKYLYEFFLFCGKLLEREDKWGSDWLLNTRDAEIISVIDLLTGGLRQSSHCSLSSPERIVLGRSLGGEGSQDKFVMLNPFSINWRISMVNAERAFGAMKETGNRLRAYMETQVHGSMAELNLDEFLSSLTIEEQELDSISSEEHSESPPNSVRSVQSSYYESDHVDQSEASSRKRIRLTNHFDNPESSLTLQSTSSSSVRTFSPPAVDKGAGGLVDHLRSIRKMIQISDEDHFTARDLTSRIQQCLKACANIPGLSYLASAEVFMSRHWGLKLQYSSNYGKNYNFPLTLLICQPKELEERGEGRIEVADDLNKIDRLLVKMDKEGNQSFLSYKLLSTDHFSLKSERNHNYTTLRYRIHRHYLRERDYFDLSIRSDPRLIVEVQVWRLLEFLCTFDSRCRPVLELTYYWAKNNYVTVGSHRGNFEELPAPSGISWLLILFFQKEGLVPSTRRLMEYPHEEKLFEGMDIGFSDNPIHATMWETERKSRKWGREHHPDSEQFAEEVLEIFYEFLRFCKELGKGSGGGYGWIVNTRDGETIPMKVLFPSSSPRAPVTNKLTFDEFVAVKESLEEKDRYRLIILNPIFINWRISTGNWEGAVGVMRRTQRKLEDYFHERKREKRETGWRGRKWELNDFLEIFEAS